MFWTVEKLASRIAELEQLRYRNVISIEDFIAIEDKEGAIGARPPETVHGKKMKVGENWSGRDRYLWLITSLFIPQEWENEEVVGIFDFGKTGAVTILDSNRYCL